MAISLIESVRSVFTPEVVDRASIRLGESKDGVHKALAGGIPTVFAGLIRRSENGQSAGLLSDVREAAIHPVAESTSALFAGSSSVPPSAGGWAARLFGGKFNLIANTLASYAGIKTGSASTLLNLLTPLSLAVVGKYALDNNLNAPGLNNFLASQKTTIMAALPTGLKIGGLFDSGMDARITTAQGQVRHLLSAPLPAPPRANWLWPVLLGLAILALIVYLVGRGRYREERIVPSAPTSTLPQAAKTWALAATIRAREGGLLRLPNHVVIGACQGRVEEKEGLGIADDTDCKGISRIL